MAASVEKDGGDGNDDDDAKVSLLCFLASLGMNILIFFFIAK